MNHSLLYIMSFLMLLTGSCYKKDLDLELIETDCKNFKISDPSYSWIVDPCTASPAKATISFKYDGEKDCIDFIEVEPKFYRPDNSEITNISYQSSIPASDPSVTITGSTVTFTFEFSFTEAPNHINMKLHTENELGNESNKLEFRLNSPCSVIDPSTYTVQQTVNVSSSIVSITLWDDAAEDGDIVCVYLNGSLVLENYTLTKAGQTFNFNINAGNNHLVLFAVNEGSSGPNTAAISVNGGSTITLHPDLLTGEAVNINF